MSYKKLSNICGVSHASIKRHAEGATPTKRVYDIYKEKFGYDFYEIINGEVRKGFVYIAKNEFGLVKIGATTKNPELRIKHIQSMTGVKFVEYSSVKSCSPFSAESRIHSMLKDKQTVGEFFNVDLEEAFWISMEVCEDQILGAIGRRVKYKQKHRSKEEIKAVVAENGGMASVARLLGVSRQAVEHYCKGKCYPKKDSKAYNVLESLFDDYNFCEKTVSNSKCELIQLKLF